MENFEEEIPKVATIASEKPEEVFKNKVRDILVGCGLLEIKNYNITNKDEQSTAIGKEFDNEKLVQVASSSSKEFDTLRKRILPSVLRTFKNNKHHEYPQNVFEIGEVFSQDIKTETGVCENSNLCVALCGEDAEYTKIRQILDVVLEALALTVKIKTEEESFYISGRAGSISVGKQTIGHIGEIHPETLGNFDIEMPVASFELDVEMLYSLLDKDVKI
jgi:phenylalanyl-tRNA synthetase beta chain